MSYKETKFKFPSVQIVIVAGQFIFKPSANFILLFVYVKNSWFFLKKHVLFTLKKLFLDHQHTPCFVWKHKTRK